MVDVGCVRVVRPQRREGAIMLPLFFAVIVVLAVAVAVVERVCRTSAFY
jgi:hypothetical protein